MDDVALCALVLWLAGGRKHEDFVVNFVFQCGNILEKKRRYEWSTCCIDKIDNITINTHIDTNRRLCFMYFEKIFTRYVQIADRIKLCSH